MSIVFFDALVYVVSEFFPLDGSAHLKLLAYYLKKAPIETEMLIVLYTAVITGVVLYFIRDIIQMVKETVKGSWRVATGRRSFKVVSSDYKWFNIFVTMLISSAISFLIFFAIEDVISSEINSNLYFIGLLLILTAGILRFTKMFTLVKIDGRLISIKDMFILGLLQSLAWFNGMSRTGLLIGIGNFLGIERTYITKFTFISIVPVLAFKLYLLGIPDPMYLFTLVYDYWMFFAYTVVILLIALRVIIPIVSSVSIHKFSIYLVGMGIWTILDVFFRKRGM